MKACRFIENLTVEDDDTVRPFRLADFQRDMIMSLFGTIRPDGKRQYKKLFAGLPRGSGKTTLIAGIALYCLLCQGKYQHIYSASGDREQAALIFDAMVGMIQRDRFLSSQIEIYTGKKRLVYPRGHSHYQALSSDSNHPLGLKPSVCLFDEVLVFPNRKLHDSLTTGMGKRGERLSIYITTAGTDKHSFCYELWQHACQVRDGIKQDPSLLPVIFAADPEKDDWKDRKVWFRSSPALGKFLSLEFLESEFAEALLSPYKQNTFCQFYLNMWLENSARWLDLESFDKLGKSLDIESYRGRQVFLGLDLASTIDLCAAVAIFPEDDGSLTIFPFFFVPKEQAPIREKRDKVPFVRWASEGHLVLTEGCDGKAVDHNAVKAWIDDFSAKFNVVKIGFDPWNAHKLMNELMDDGQPVVQIRPVMANLTAPSKELERLILAGKVNHDNNPVMRWCVANCSVQQDAQGNVMPSKVKSSERIDGVSACVLAMACLLAERGIEPSIGFLDL